MDERALFDLTYGMYVISTKYNGKDVGCFVNTVSQVTAQSPTITLSINKENYTNEAIKNNKIFAVSILSINSNPEIIGKFGFFSSRDTNKFENISCIEENGIKVVDENICGYIICELINTVDVGTHDIFVAKVIKAVKKANFEPMTYKYYHDVIKGSAPKTAPTYVEEKSGVGKKYKCTICGYIYDDEKEEIKFTDLPSDWKCPICGVGKEMFEEI